MTLRNWGLMIVLMACAFLVVGQLYVTIPLVAGIASEFETSAENAIYVGSTFGIAYAVGFLVFGTLSDRYGRKRVLVLGLTATSLATVMVGFAPSLGLLLAARAAQGFAAASFPPTALSLVAETLPTKYRPFGLSMMSFSFLSAAPLAQFYSAQSASSLSVIMLDLAPYYVLGALGLFILIATTKCATDGEYTPRGELFRSLVEDPGKLAAWAAALTVLFSFVVFHSGAQALGDTLNLDLQVLRLVGLPPLLLAFAAAPLIRYLGAPSTAQLGMVVAALSFALVARGHSTAFMLASIVLSAGIALTVPSLIATVASRASHANRGLALAIYSFTLFLGASIAPPIAQALAKESITAMWLLPVTCLLIAAFIMSAAKKRKISISSEGDSPCSTSNP